MLADQADYVIGVDTHRDTHTAVVLDAAGAGQVAEVTVPADGRGYARLDAFARRHAPERRAFAIEQAGSYGAGLLAYLDRRGERVVEVDRPRATRRRAGKSDAIDALRAAREALERPHPAAPRRRGEREAIRVLLRTREGAVKARAAAICHLRSLVVTAPEALRSRLRELGPAQLVRRCARLRTSPAHSAEERATVLALRSSARRIASLGAEAAELEAELRPLVERACPALLREQGVGTITAAELLNAWSHPGRVRSEAAFARLGGVAPLPASSGLTVRHRLSRGGDRRLNRALETIVITRLRGDAESRAYAARRTAEGRSPREVRRCLKRYVARRLFKLLEQEASMA